jgi:hypothetical protein
MGCSSNDGAVEGAAEQSSGLTAPGGVTEFVVLTSGAIRLGDRARVVGGHLGAGLHSNTAVRVGADGRVALGKALVGRAIALGDRARVGAVFAETLNGPYATFESLSAFEQPPAPSPFTEFTAGTDAVEVRSGSTRVLEAGNFGVVSVNGTLRLAGGAYQLAELRLGNDAALIADAPAFVRVLGDLKGQDRVALAPSTPAYAGDLRVIVAGPTGVSLGNDARLSGLVLASSAVRAGDRLLGSGSIGAAAVTLGHDARFEFDTGFDCNANDACEDGNSCTLDGCRDGFCESTALADDVSCRTAEGVAGTCQAETCVPVPSSARVQEILASCVGCHGGVSPSAGLDLTNILAVRDAARASSRCSDALPILAPGDPARSYLLLKVMDTPACAPGRTACGPQGEDAACRLGQRMPRGLPPLPEAEIEELRQWIVAGAPD